MVIEINEDKYKCKVWIDDKPQGACAGELKLGEKLPSKGKGKFRSVSVSAEFYRYCRHCSYYGLLGFEYTSDESGELSLTANFTEKTLDSKKLKGYAPEEFSEGIEEFYSGAILAEACKLFGGEEVIPSGNMDFCFGKTGDVGSSEIIFRFLVNVLVDLFYLREEADERQAKVIIEKNLCILR